MKKGLYTVGQLLILVIVFATPLFGQAMTITKEYVYTGNDFDTAETCKIIGFEQAKRLIFDELETNIINDNRFKRLQLPKNRLMAYAEGIVTPEISNEKWDGRNYSFKIRIGIDSDKILNFTGLHFKDKEKTEELEETKKNTEEALKRIKKLQKEISPDKKNREKQAQYLAAVEQLNLEQWIEKGYVLINESQYKTSIEAFDKAIAFKQKPRSMKQEVNSGTVATPAAHLRSQPSRNAPPAGYVTKGTLLLILDESRDDSGGLWYRIKLPVSKKEAWIAGGAVTRAKQDIQIGDNNIYSIARAYTGRGNANMKSGKSDAAIEDYNKAIELSPHSATAYNYRGLSYMNLGDYKKAIEDFSIAIQLKPDNIAGYINRGFAYSELNDFQKAKKDLDHAIHMEPRNEFPYLSRGRLYAKSGDFKEAIKDYDMVLALNPRISIAYASRGINYAALKNYEKALKDLYTAIELNPKNTDALYSLGSVYLNMGETEKAVENYKAAARLGDKDAQGYLKRKGILWDEK
jgi:tetratricopeptide (TPR) repeat protein